MTLNSNKVNTNQNLIPSKLTYKYLYQKTVIPALIVIIAVAFLSVVVFHGGQKLVDMFNNRSIEYESQSLADKNIEYSQTLGNKTNLRDKLQNQYDNYYKNNPIKVTVDDSILKVLQNDIARLKKELAALDSTPEKPVDVNKKYQIDELLLYIDNIRTQNIVIISMEDNKSETASGSNYLVYQNDVGQATFSLHGMATSSLELSSFMLSLNECQYIASTRIVSVETQTLSDGTSLYVFEIGITPKVN
jgi:hypothetical protein